MRTVSQDLLGTFTGSFTAAIQVDVWRDGTLLEANLPVSAGNYSQGVGSTRINLTVSDPDGSHVPNNEGALAPYGSELFIKVGALIAGKPSWINLGWFPIVTTGAVQNYQIYKRLDGQEVSVSRGASVSLECTDRMQVLNENKFLTRVQPVVWNSVFQEVSRLCLNVVPWAGSPGGWVTDVQIPTTAQLTYEDDRMAAIQQLLNIVNADPQFNSAGQLIALSRLWPGYSTYTLAAGESGVRVSMDRVMQRDGKYNVAVVRTTDYAGNAVIVTAKNNVPPTQFDGPMKRVPFFIDDGLLGTTAAAQKRADEAIKDLLKSNYQSIGVTCLWNPALEVGDQITIPAPKGNLPGRITGVDFDLLGKGGTMQLTVDVDAFLLAEVT